MASITYHPSPLICELFTSHYVSEKRFHGLASFVFILFWQIYVHIQSVVNYKSFATFHLTNFHCVCFTFLQSMVYFTLPKLRIHFFTTSKSVIWVGLILYGQCPLGMWCLKTSDLMTCFCLHQIHIKSYVTNSLTQSYKLKCQFLMWSKNEFAVFVQWVAPCFWLEMPCEVIVQTYFFISLDNYKFKMLHGHSIASPFLVVTTSLNDWTVKLIIYCIFVNLREFFEFFS